MRGRRVIAIARGTDNEKNNFSLVFMTDQQTAALRRVGLQMGYAHELLSHFSAHQWHIETREVPKHSDGGLTFEVTGSSPLMDVLLGAPTDLEVEDMNGRSKHLSTDSRPSARPARSRGVRADSHPPAHPSRPSFDKVAAQGGGFRSAATTQ